MFQDTIRIGTLVNAAKNAPGYIRQILPHGFESFSLTFWQTLGDCDLKKLAREVAAVLEGSDAVISSICVFGNPLAGDDLAAQSRDGWKKLIDHAQLFGCDVVAGFSGRVPGEPIDKCIKPWAKVFKPLVERAKDKGVRLAFENCERGGTWKSGTWNIAQTPMAWEMMWDALPADNLGLEWEPCHQMVKLIDPMAQLRKYVKKIFHVHGKDATIMWDVIREHGINGPAPWCFHRTPGFGDSNWTDIISELRRGGFKGSIDIEGWHDPVYRAELEMTGQVAGMNYLKRCRTSFVPNPKQ